MCEADEEAEKGRGTGILWEEEEDELGGNVPLSGAQQCYSSPQKYGG